MCAVAMMTWPLYGLTPYCSPDQFVPETVTVEDRIDSLLALCVR